MQSLCIAGVRHAQSPLFALVEHTGAVTGLQLLPQQGLLASCSTAGELLFWDYVAQRCVHRWDHRDSFLSLALRVLPEGVRRLAAAGMAEDGCVQDHAEFDRRVASAGMPSCEAEAAVSNQVGGARHPGWEMLVGTRQGRMLRFPVPQVQSPVAA